MVEKKRRIFLLRKACLFSLILTIHDRVSWTQCERHEIVSTEDNVAPPGSYILLTLENLFGSVQLSHYFREDPFTAPRRDIRNKGRQIALLVTGNLINRKAKGSSFI